MMRRRFFALVAIAMLIVLSTSCSEKRSRPDAVAKASPAGQVSPGGPASGSPSPQASGTGAPRVVKPTATPSAGANPSSTPSMAPGTEPAEVTAKLAHSCVRRGGTQSLTLRTEPNFYVAYDTQYSDGKDGKEYGGLGTAQVGGDGKYFSPWVVSPAAPLGDVIVWISVAGPPNKTAFRQLHFTVASTC
jgi:hypothetical protein